MSEKGRGWMAVESSWEFNPKGICRPAKEKHSIYLHMYPEGHEVETLEDWESCQFLGRARVPFCWLNVNGHKCGFVRENHRFTKLKI